MAVESKYKTATYCEGASKSATIDGINLIPRPPRFFVLQFLFSIIHGSGRARKTGKAREHLSRE